MEYFGGKWRVNKPEFFAKDRNGPSGDKDGPNGFNLQYVSGGLST